MSKPSTSRIAPRLSAAMAVGLLIPVLAACGSGGTSGPKASAGGKTVTVAVSTKVPGGNMLQVGIAETKGYFKAEGINVKFVFLESSGACVQAIASGHVQIGQSTPDLVLQAIDKGQDIKMFYNWTSHNVTGVGVLPDSPIQSVSDLKGKTVGVQTLAAGPTMLAKAAMVQAGLDPKKDVNIIAVGVGAPALNALQTHRIDAMITYDSQFSAMTTGTGAVLRIFQPAGVEDLFSSSFVASTDWLKNNPDIASGFGRAWAKASVYAQANPEAGVKMMFAKYPNSEIGPDVKAATAAAMGQFNAREQSLYAGSPPATQEWGSYPESAVAHWIAYEKDQNMIKSNLDVTKVYTNEFVSKFNDFNVAETKTDAGAAATP